MTSLSVEQLYEHPIKSCAARPVAAFTLDARGPTGDRRWMLVDADGKFVSQRKFPMLARVNVVPEPDGLRVQDADRTLHVAPPTDGELRVTVWGDACRALDAGDEAAAWFSAVTQHPVRLVRQCDDDDRNVDTRFAEGPVGFADGFPLLLTTRATLDAIAERSGTASDARRFRPNIVVGGAEAFAEDTWKTVRVGDIVIDLVKPCARCVMVNVDPDAAVAGTQPLRTLAKFRRREGGVMVGQNGMHRTLGHIATGAPVEVLTRAEP